MVVDPKRADGVVVYCPDLGVERFSFPVMVSYVAADLGGTTSTFGPPGTVLDYIVPLDTIPTDSQIVCGGAAYWLGEVTSASVTDTGGAGFCPPQPVATPYCIWGADGIAYLNSCIPDRAAPVRAVDDFTKVPGPPLLAPFSVTNFAFIYLPAAPL